MAAAFQQGGAAGHYGTIAELTRVMLLAPLVLAVGYLAYEQSSGPSEDMSGEDGSGGAVPIPWFVFGFVAMMAVASTGSVPAAADPWHEGLNQFLLAMALAAMGLETDVRKLVAEGARPAILGAACPSVLGVRVDVRVPTGEEATDPSDRIYPPLRSKTNVPTNRPERTAPRQGAAR